MWYKQHSSFYEKEKESVRNTNPKLVFSTNDDLIILEGKLEFYASFNNQEISDSYLIRIIFPNEYPNYLPEAYEIGNRIPENYHKNTDTSLCLGAPPDQIQKFNVEPNILNYINNLVIPYLYRFSFIEKFGKAPFDDYSHGALGLLEYYFDYFDINSIPLLGKFFLLILENTYRGHSICPCGSNKKIRICHGSKIMRISKLPKAQIVSDFEQISKLLEISAKNQKGVHDESKRIISVTQLSNKLACSSSKKVGNTKLSKGIEFGRKIFADSKLSNITLGEIKKNIKNK